MRVITRKREQIYQGNLILVNAQYAYHENVQPDAKIAGVGAQPDAKIAGADVQPDAKIAGSAMRDTRVDVKGQKLLAEAAGSLNALMESLNGWQQIAAVSGWRSFREQQEIWDESMRDNGETFTRTYVAVPGHSEHQTGLAMDLGFRQGEIDFIRPAFPYEGICQKVRERAAEYGFVERYPAGKEAVTGIGHEPWHFRYVGVPHAAVMKQKGMVLEEYISYLRSFEHGVRALTTETGGRKVWLSFQKAEPSQVTKIVLNEAMEVSVSGNNVDGFVIAQWRKME